MMLTMLQQPGGADTFLYYLGLQLGKTVAELGSMDYTELVHWNAYFTAKSAIENQKPVSP